MQFPLSFIASVSEAIRTLRVYCPQQPYNYGDNYSQELKI